MVANRCIRLPNGNAPTTLVVVRVLLVSPWGKEEEEERGVEGEVERKAAAAPVAGRWRVHALIDAAAAPLEEEEMRKRNTATMVGKL